ncbi:hypothetical protein ASE49_12320 [Novosphingobium sp. Leaf2]|nr:hypothetical protein ASE49_12320 [Novosphingobium sp. Leaf2]
MTADLLLFAAVAFAVFGIAVLRWAWGLARRSHAITGGGWLLVLLGTILGWLGDGAWGTAIVALGAMTTALALLAFAASTSKPGKVPASTRRTGMLPEGDEPKRIGARTLTFVLAGLVCAVVSIGIAVAANMLAKALGLGAADALALAFFAMPLAWTVLSYAVLMATERRRQIRILAYASVPSWVVATMAVMT